MFLNGNMAAACCSWSVQAETSGIDYFSMGNRKMQRSVMAVWLSQNIDRLKVRHPCRFLIGWNIWVTLYHSISVWSITAVLCVLTHQPAEFEWRQDVEGFVGWSEEGERPLLVQQLSHTCCLDGGHQEAEMSRGEGADFHTCQVEPHLQHYHGNSLHNVTWLFRSVTSLCVVLPGKQHFLLTWSDRLP